MSSMERPDLRKPEAITNLARTPLFDLAVEYRARLTAFSGWEMPLQYAGVKQEHEAVRTSAGIFDISHMGKFALKSKDLLKQLQFLVPSDLERLQKGRAQYTVLLNDRAGIIDDLIIYYQGENEAQKQQAIAIVNAATASKDKAWLSDYSNQRSIELEDLSHKKVLIALQGPKASNFLQPLVKEDLTAIKAFEHIMATLLGESAFIARTGYTGEDGFEIMVDPAVGIELWRSLVGAGVTPCGLGARDTLRLEAAMCLYGQDIDENTTPFEAGLGWLVHLDSKGDFIGRSVLESQKAIKNLERKLVGIQMLGRHIARHGYPIIFKGEKVGEITSGTLSLTINKPIALAYVPGSIAKVGQQLEVEIRQEYHPAIVVKKPFYSRV